MAFRSLFLTLVCSFYVANASVTVYNQLPLGASTTSATDSAAAASYTGSAAYDPTVLVAPPIPNPPPGNQFPINLMPSADMVQGISIEAPSSFFGLSIEMSVATQISEYRAHVSYALVPDRLTSWQECVSLCVPVKRAVR